MRVAFFGQTGPYAPVALRHLLASRGELELAVVVVGTRPVPQKATHRWYDPRPAPLPTNEDLVALAVAAGIRTLRTSDVNDPTVIAELQRLRLEMAVCVGFDRLFVPSLLAVPRLGFLNSHPSDLPLLRGPSPIFWALKQGRRDLAVTIHAMDAREDHGLIFAQSRFVLTPRASGEEIFAAAARLAGQMLLDCLRRASRDQLGGTAQDDRRATRAPRPKPEDAFVVPSDWSAEALVNFASGAPFFRTPWLRFHEEPFFIRQGLRVEPGRSLPAQYVLNGSTLIVACKDGLAHLEVQI
jgi:methionyl-tRNA formyltransferase